LIRQPSHVLRGDAPAAVAHNHLNGERTRAGTHAYLEVWPVRGAPDAHLRLFEPGPNLARELGGIETASPDRLDRNGHRRGARARLQPHHSERERQQPHDLIHSTPAAKKS